jgi:tetratricopeptide (TPR) repeat protein
LHTRIERTLWGHPHELGFAHEQLGVNLVNIGPLSEACKHLHIAFSIYEQCGLLSDMVHVSGNLGAAYIMKGDHATAREFLDRSLELAERIGDLPNMTFVTSNLADVAHRSGDLLIAVEWFQRSLELAERIDDHDGLSWSNVELASVQCDLGQLTEAKRSLMRAISIGRTIKNPRCLLYALAGVGEMRIVEALQHCPSLADHPNHQHHSDHPICQRLLHRAKATLQHALSQDGLEIETFTNAQYLLATAFFLLGQVTEAQQLAQQTLRSALENETGLTVGRTYRLLGWILASQGLYQQAEHSVLEALNFLTRSDLRLEYARTLHCLGTILLRQEASWLSVQESKKNAMKHLSLHPRAMNCLREAQQIFAECHAAVDLAWITPILA